jgi:hypothetical protein
MRLSLIVPFGLVIASSGCFTTERVGRPPSADEIVRINETARSGRALVVEYAPAATAPGAIAPLGARCAGGSCPSPPVEPLCAGGGCPPVELTKIDEDPASVYSVDDHEITFNLRSGARATAPLDAVAGLKVTGYGRARGAAIGAAICGGLELGAAALLIVALRGAFSDPGAPMPPHGCDAKCAEFIAIPGIEGALVGGIIGALIGTPHHFRFGDAPAATEH